MGGRLDEAESLLAVAEQAFEHASSEPYEPSVGRTASILHNVPAMLATGRADLARQRGNAELAYRLARQAEAQLEDEDRCSARSCVTTSRWPTGWTAGWMTPNANSTMSSPTRTASGERHLVLRASYNLGGVQQAQGRLGAALRTYRRGLEMASAQPPLPSPVWHMSGWRRSSMSVTNLTRHLEHASVGVALCRELAYTPPLVTGLLILARIQQAGVTRLPPPTRSTRGGRPTPGHQPAEPRGRRGRPADARQSGGYETPSTGWRRGTRGGGRADLPARGRVPRARASVARHPRLPERASVLLHRWHVLAAVQQRTGSIIELLALQALARAGEGDQSKALADLAEAVALGAQEAS